MIDDAIILAGGLGTRMLPASLFTPKEALPLVDTPILNHLIWEVAKTGVTRVHLVLSKRKYHLLEDFFYNKNNVYEGVRPDLPRNSLSMSGGDLQIIPHIQEEPGGVGDAISVAIDSIEGDFLVLLGDMLLIERHLGPKFSGPNFASKASERLVSAFNESGLPCVGYVPVEWEEIGNYGVIEVMNNYVIDIVEKPDSLYSKSNLILCGRYVFPERMKDLLLKFPVSIHGEMQSIEIMKHLSRDEGLIAVDLGDMDLYDSGDPVSWLKAQVDHALQRDDLSQDFSKWLRKRISKI